jgi:hypothetical protein
MYGGAGRRAARPPMAQRRLAAPPAAGPAKAAPTGGRSSSAEKLIPLDDVEELVLKEF